MKAEHWPTENFYKAKSISKKYSPIWDIDKTFTNTENLWECTLYCTKTAKRENTLFALVALWVKSRVLITYAEKPKGRVL